MCSSYIKGTIIEYTIYEVVLDGKRKRIRESVQLFSGEEEQQALDREFVVAELPAYVARSENNMIRFVSFMETKHDIVIVTLGMLPFCQV